MPSLTAKAIARLAPLPRSFYSRDPRLVARELLGKLLIRTAPTAEGPSHGAHPPASEVLAGRIVEAEAYLGAIDPGSHAYRGLTPRNAVLFGPPGHAYIYFIYGNHYCTNVSCQPPGYGVLLRALEPVIGISAMAASRGLAFPPAAEPTRAQLRQLTSGPGRLSQALAITRPRDNDCDLCSRSHGLFIADDDFAPAPIAATPRINVTSAPLDKWRYILTGNPFVSGKRS
jgi:DNA-3-methyladenine glycosylase